MPSRIQIMLGSGVIQMWYPAEPHFKEFPLETPCGKMLYDLIRDSSKFKLVNFNNSVETYERIQEAIY